MTCDRTASISRSAAAILLIAVIALALPGAASGADPVEVREVDEYSKTVPSSGLATFTWTLRNVDPLNITYRVEALVTGVPAGWSALFDSSSSPALRFKESVSFVLRVGAPAAGSGSANLTAEFRVHDGAALVQVTKRSAELGINEPASREKLVLGIFTNPLKQYDPFWATDLGVFLLDVLIWTGISVAVLLILDPVVRALTRRTKTQVDDIVLGIVRTPAILIVFSFGVVNSLEALDRRIDPSLLAWIERAYLFILTIALFYVAYRLFRDLILHYGKQIAKRTASRLDDILIPVVEKLGTVVIIVVFVGYVLGIFSVDLSLFVAGGVVVSMVIAFAAQDSLSNFFSGIFLLLDRPFEEGHQIILEDGEMYEVRKIGLRTTRLFRFKDATVVSIPNNSLVNAKVARFTGVRDKGVMHYKFGVAYGSDPARVKEIIRDAVKRCAQVADDPPPVVRFEEMGADAIIFYAQVRVKERGDRHLVTDFLNTEIYGALNRAGIEIPFPQRTVWLRQEKGEKAKLGEAKGG